MNGGQTPRCLRRADSGMPGELTPRSDSSNSPPLDVVCSVGGQSSNTSSETSSSGVHSNASNASHSSSQRRATSVDDLTGETSREESPNQWRSCSLQRGTQPPTANSNFAMPMSNNRNNYPNNNQPYPMVVTNNHNGLYNGNNETGCPAVLMQNSNDSTVVIHRRLSRTKLTEAPQNMNEEPFGRPTNMRLTSFTENNDLRAIQASSATLPHYPTQPVVTYPHCSTMPLPHASHAVIGSNGSAAGSSGSCGNVLSQRLPTIVPHQIQTAVPSHTTLPSHHNGVRLAPGNPFVKRFPPAVHTQSWQLPGHHTFPQLPSTQKLPMPGQIRQSDRDSANFSMASSGDSDTCLPH